MQAKALYKCTADDKGELSFEEDDIIIDVTESKEEGWFEGRVQGTSVRGLFPFNYVEFIREQQQQQQQSLTPSKAIPLNNSSSETSARTLFSSSVSPPNSTLSSTWSVISNKDSSLSSQDNHNGTAPADIITPSFVSRTGTDKGSDAFDRIMAMQPPVIINKPPGGTTVVSKLAGLDNIQQQPKPSIAPKPTQLLKKKPSIGNKNPTSTNTLATERLPIQSPIAPLTNSASPSVASRVRSLSISASGTNSRPENTAPVKLPSLYNKPNSNNTISPLIKTAAAAIDTDNNSNSNKPDNKNISRKAIPIIQPKPYTSSTKSTTAAHNNRPMLKQPERVMFDNNPVNENEEDVEDVDGYQLVRPSQIRQRQAQGSTMITPKAMPTLARVNLKQSSNSNILLSKQSNSISSSSSLPSSSSAGLSSSSNKDNKKNLDGIPGASNPAPRLPSRPVSKAGRRSRSSKMMSTAVAASPEPVATISSTKLPPPGPKPKPSQLSAIASDAAIETSNSPSQRSKGRSISNPPPIQPKPFISKSININNNNSNNHTKPDVPPTQNKPEGIIKKQSAAAAQASTTTTLKTTPAVPARPGIIDNNQQWQQQQENQSDDSNNNSNTEDTNVKPSEILMRTRSKSNGWTQPTSKYNNNVPVLPARSAAQKTEATAVVAITSAKKTPPPPPPSRPVQRQQNGPTTPGVPIRYEELFSAINDKGYVDGETTKIIWQRSKVADELLAKIWQQCDPQGSGLLDKNAFIQGMREIDAILESSM
ncbi:hypothetical protein INT45_003215 [Circinella minor]|uniref:SH3 domain-containing protein n=1 Tax=Circinella minor TaxID=1195481 RepID=A0A8H7SAC5_9FUNG|nr:hypothetical protein INT45_003215 [Circinella minor]